jgi:hypothetical protein
MKKSKKYYIYVAAPVVGVLIFSAVYLNFRSSYEAQKDADAAVVQKAKDDQIRAQNEERKEAVAQAVAAADKRKKEREQKEKERQQRNDDRQAAFQARDKAQVDEAKFRDLAEKRRKEVAVAKEEIAKIEQDESVLRGEKAFLDTFVKKVVGNQQYLSQVLDRVKKAEDADAAAAAAAAAAAKAKKS